MGLKAWRSHNQGRNNVAYRRNRQGIYITPSSRAFRDEEGKSFWVDVEIVDKYRFPSGSQAPYNVSVSPNFFLVLETMFESLTLWICLLSICICVHKQTFR